MVDVKEFFEKDTATLSYVVSDTATGSAVIIDPVLNYDHFTGTVGTQFADGIMDYVHAQKLKPLWLLETHIHADHITAAHYLKHKYQIPVAISSQIKSVLSRWVPFFNTADDTPLDASQFDRLLDDGDTLPFGNSTIRVIHTPGHTPSCVSYVIEHNIFVGDALFMPDVGAGRADFPGGDAGTLYDSIQKILSFADSTKVYCGHDYPTADRAASGLSTVGTQKEKNILVKTGVSREDFIAIRTDRDRGKPIPRLLYPAIQVNLRSGDFGATSPCGHHFIKIPVESNSNTPALPKNFSNKDGRS